MAGKERSACGGRPLRAEPGDLGGGLGPGGRPCTKERGAAAASNPTPTGQLRVRRSSPPNSKSSGKRPHRAQRGPSSYGLERGTLGRGGGRHAQRSPPNTKQELHRG